MIGLILIGALMGGAIYLLVLRLAPPRPSAIVLLGRLDARTPPRTTTSTGLDGADTRSTVLARWQAQCGRAVWRVLTNRGIGYTTLRQDLALAGRDPDQAMGVKILAAAAGLPAGLLVLVLIQQDLGVTLPPEAGVIIALAAATGCFFLPDLDARRRASRRRREMRHALTIYLDLVALEMAASAAPAEALPAAARIGGSWPFALLRDTLTPAVLAGRDQWDALTEVGERVGIAELRELGMLVRLVAHDGAKVRQTLVDRAASMRSRELAESEGQAGQRKQSMQIAQVLLGFGFVIFLAYPALANVAGFG